MKCSLCCRSSLWAGAALATLLAASCTSNTASITGTGGATASGGGSGGGAGGQLLGSGGATSSGGTAASTRGGNGSGGKSGTAGATGNGGASAAGGMTAAGGAAAASGGAGLATGGKAGTGGAGRGGSTGAGGMISAGGATGTGNAGGTGTTCPLPKTFKWTSTGPLATPQNGSLALKDFTNVVYNSQHIVYFTTVGSSGNWGGGMVTFADWPDMATATQHALPMGSVAPTLIYFTPKSTWVLTYQWGFQYATSSDPTDPTKWSGGKTLLNGGPPTALDQTFICDGTTCYLFFAGDNGSIYRSSMPIGNYPGTFNGYQTVMTDTAANLFEAVEVYTVKGANQYLLIIEAAGSAGRYFRSFTATDLAGSWTPLAATESNPFAGKANVTFTGAAWTHDISHGDLVRNNPDETQTVDPCNLQFLYQGDAPTSGLQYFQVPYRPGVLTLVQ